MLSIGKLQAISDNIFTWLALFMNRVWGNDEDQIYDRQWYLDEELAAAAVEPEVDAIGPLSVIPNFFLSALHITHFAKTKWRQIVCVTGVLIKRKDLEDLLWIITER